MKKVLIISYFFPPANYAGSFRAASWAKHLHAHGYYPVVITRCWNDNQTVITDEVTDNTLKHEKTDEYEIYRLPIHENLRDRLYKKYGDKRFVLLRKFLTLLEIALQPYTNFFIPYSNFCSFAQDLIRTEKDFSCLILSGKPYQLFKFGYQLHRSTGIKWIADYRDEWTTHQWLHNESRFIKKIYEIEAGSEKKWLSNASLFTTCSDSWVTSIGRFINKKGRVVLNGYEGSQISAVTGSSSDTDVFTILHSGSLYASQPIEVFLHAYRMLLERNANAKIIMLFPGLDNSPPQSKRVHDIMKGYEKYIWTSDRLPKEKLLEMAGRAGLFLSVGIPDVKGLHSSKIFEYLAFGRPVLLCPGDKDVLEKVVNDTKAGYTVHSTEEAFAFLQRSYNDFVNKKPIPYAPDTERIKFYSREKQTEILAAVLDEVTNT